MKQKFTTEKHKYLENKNLKNESMFNFKISCLMKKQVINVMMTLAIVFGLSVSAMAQGAGQAPGSTKELIVGSAATFTVADVASPGGGVATAYAWTVLTGTSAHADGEAQTGNTTTQGTNWQFVNSRADHTTATPAADANEVNVKFLTLPSVSTADDDIYIVQVTSESADGCSTIRRFYISIFDFEVEVFAANLDANGPVGSEPLVVCNSWSSSVIKNWDGTDEYEGDDLTAYSPTDVNNATDDEPKVTTRNFGVRITLVGANSTNLNTLKWRMRYSLISGDEASDDDLAAEDADLLLYQISSLTSTDQPLFSGESGTTSIENATGDLTIVGTDTWDSNNNIYFPKKTDGTPSNEAIYYFSVSTHNILSANDMNWGVQVDKVALETSPDDQTAYDNGAKVHESLDVTNDIVLDTDNSRSEVFTINQSPATSVIDFVD